MEQGLEKIQLSQIAEVLGARAEELFSIVKDIIEEKDFKDDILGGFILTGGGVSHQGNAGTR